MSAPGHSEPVLWDPNRGPNRGAGASFEILKRGYLCNGMRFFNFFKWIQNQPSGIMGDRSWSQVPIFKDKKVEKKWGDSRFFEDFLTFLA